MEKVGSTSTNENSSSFAFSSSIDPDSGEAVIAPDAAEEEDDGEEADAEDDEDPEDEFNEAWEVLDLARTIWEKEREEGKDVGRELGECYSLLGDVSLETGELVESFVSFPFFPFLLFFKGWLTLQCMWYGT
jgi:HAT1-interacting factor 1